MNEDVKEKKDVKEEIMTPFIAGTYVGNYTIRLENKFYIFQFPINNRLDDNLRAIEYIKDEILKALEYQAKKEEEEKSKKDQK